jgi:hypothetical protein
MKRRRQIYLKERLSKVGDFDESKVYAIFDMLIANGQLTLPPCKRPAKKVDDSNYVGPTGRGTYTKTVFSL